MHASFIVFSCIPPLLVTFIHLLYTSHYLWIITDTGVASQSNNGFWHYYAEKKGFQELRRIKASSLIQYIARMCDNDRQPGALFDKLLLELY